MFTVATLGLADTVSKLPHPTVWRTHDIVETPNQLVKLYLELDARVRIKELVNLFSLRVYKYAESLKSVFRDHRSQPPTLRKWLPP